MEKRPHLNIELSFADKIVEFVGWMLLTVLWILVGLTYFNLPPNIPTHFNASGQANGYGSKMTYVLLPVLGTILYVGMTALNRYPWIFNYINYTYDNALQQYTYATKMIRFLKTAIIFVFLLINLFTWLTASGKTNGLGRWFLPCTLALFLIPSAFYIVKSLSKVKER